MRDESGDRENKKRHEEKEQSRRELTTKYYGFQLLFKKYYPMSRLQKPSLDRIVQASTSNYFSERHNR